MMGASDLIVGDESDWLGGEFFAPASTDLVTGLVAEYSQAKGWIEQVADFADGDVFRAVIGYFLGGNATQDRGRSSMETSAAQLFQKAGAIAALNSTYWSKALALTDVYDAMPRDERTKWNEQIRNPLGRKENKYAREKELPPLPDFEEGTVRATLADLLNSRTRFFAQRVDGIFRALSGEHVTNSPAAFGKRMIIAHLITSYDTINHDQAGYISDLRCVIAKFMGRDEPHWDATARVVELARKERRGEWVTLDGGALRLRAYKRGTAHLEVHPDMAWRLNCVLANLYPMAIPPEFRAKPKKQPKDFVMVGRPLPFSVIAVLEAMKRAVRLEENTGPNAWSDKYRRVEIPNAMQFSDGGKENSPTREEAARVMAYMGGVKVKNDRGGIYFEFDYNPRDVIAEVICSGCLPDQKTHQFYPTPERLARIAVELAEIGPDDTCMEPSAGTGGIADYLPKERTRCIEISDLHCKVLQAKEFDATRADFLDWSTRTRDRFDRVVMNPPFSEGRAQAHLEAAASLVKARGRIVAILPASMRGKCLLPGWDHTWSEVYSGEFAGTGVSVSILVAEAA